MKEKGPEYYNEIYSKEDSPYLGQPEELIHYYPSWTRAVDIIMRKSKVIGGIRIVDAGCGPGHFPRILEEKGFFSNEKNSYFGYDFSSQAIKMAKKMVNHKNAYFYEKNIISDENPFREAYSGRMFDSIIFVSFEFLEHVEEDLGVFDKMKKNSDIFITVPNFDSTGHVRFFEKTKDVSDRYGEKILIKREIEEHYIKDDKLWKLYFVRGKVR